MIETVYDEGGFPIFLVDYEAMKEAGFSATVRAVSGWNNDYSVHSTEPYLKCLIKWDSCSHFYFGEEDEADGYLHFCGVRSFRNHVKLLHFLYDLAFKAMGREPEKGEEWE